MKIDYKRLALFTVAFSLMAGMLISPAMNVTADSLEIKYGAAKVELHTDGSFTPDLNSLYHKFGVPLEILHSVNPDYMMALSPEMQERGLQEVYFDQVRNQWRVSFTSIIEAPLLNIWKTEPAEGMSLSATENNVDVGPTQSARSDQNMGMSFFYGSASYQLENETEDSGASWEYTTDFLVDNYEILYLDEIGDYNSNNLSIVVSYVENLSYANLNSTYAYNLTIFNEPVDGYKDLWFRLDLENTNTTFDAYVANLELKNFNTKGGRYILSVDANTTDSRYTTNYVGSLNTPVSTLSVSSAERFQSRYEPSLHTSDYNSLGLSAWYDSITAEDVYDISAELVGKSVNSVSEARGWADATDLEDAIKQSIVDKFENDNYFDISEIDDLTITDAIMNWEMPEELVNAISSAVDTATDLYDTLSSVVENVAEEVVPRVQFATDVTAPDISEDSKTANDVTDTTAGVVAADTEGANNFGRTVSNFFTNTAGSIVEGAVSVWTGLEEKGEDLGLGGMLPYLILGGIALIIVIVIWRSRMM